MMSSNNCRWHLKILKNLSFIQKMAGYSLISGKQIGMYYWKVA